MESPPALPPSSSMRESDLDRAATQRSADRTHAQDHHRPCGRLRHSAAGTGRRVDAEDVECPGACALRTGEITERCGDPHIAIGLSEVAAPRTVECVAQSRSTEVVVLTECDAIGARRKCRREVHVEGDAGRGVDGHAATVILKRDAVTRRQVVQRQDRIEPAGGDRRTG